jgi:hypothetical protein
MEELGYAAYRSCRTDSTNLSTSFFFRPALDCPEKGAMMSRLLLPRTGHGDLQWTPKPFRFEESTSLRQSPAAIALHVLSAFNFVEPAVVEAFLASLPAT